MSCLIVSSLYFPPRIFSQIGEVQFHGRVYLRLQDGQIHGLHMSQLSHLFQEHKDLKKGFQCSNDLMQPFTGPLLHILFLEVVELIRKVLSRCPLFK